MDYTSTPITATFPAGVNSTTINIPVISDNIVEENETLQLKIFVPVPTKYAVESGNSALIIITDNSSTYVHMYIFSIKVFKKRIYSKEAWYSIHDN